MDDPCPNELSALNVAAWAAFARGELDACMTSARAAVERFKDHGEGWYVLAACLERSGKLAEADRCFRRASFAKHGRQPPPFRVSWRRFEKVIDDARQAVPDKLRQALEEVTITLANYAEPALIPEGTGNELLGLFVGQERAERAHEDLAATPIIYVFRRAHEHQCGSLAEFADEAARTLYHEFGHYLGYDEDGLEWLGMD